MMPVVYASMKTNHTPSYTYSCTPLLTQGVYLDGGGTWNQNGVASIQAVDSKCTCIPI